jgi:hypothetical protein
MVTGKQYADEALKIFNMSPQAGYIWGTRGVLWTQARQNQLNKTTDSERASGRKYGKKWIGHYVWDCSGLTSYCGLKFDLKYHHGSNSSYLYDCQAKGKLTKNMELPVGAWVYTKEKEGKKPHIGVYTGDGMVTEAAGTIQGVIQSKLHGGKWYYWGLGKGITFDFIPGKSTTEAKEETKTASTTTKKVTYPTQKYGSKGELVTQLQDLLSKDGYNLKVDGIFGPGTRSCVRAFQQKHGLEVDGIVGPKTWAELLKVK